MRPAGQVWFLLTLLMGVALLGAAELAAQGKITWQSNLAATPQGILLGIRDKMGDMDKAYRVMFQMVTPDQREFTLWRQVPAGHDEFVEVVFPRDFQAPANVLRPGAYLCTYAVNQKPIIKEKFTYRQTGGVGHIQNRKTWFAGSNTWH